MSGVIGPDDGLVASYRTDRFEAFLLISLSEPSTRKHEHCGKYIYVLDSGGFPSSSHLSLFLSLPSLLPTVNTLHKEERKIESLLHQVAFRRSRNEYE